MHNIDIKIYGKYLLVFLVTLYSCTLKAQPSSELKVEGLKEVVEIHKDEWGVNHIYAANQHDLFFAQGYAAAKDRLFQFEMWRRQATGTVAEILGSDEIKRDVGARLFKFRGDLKKEFNHYHPDGESIIKAYTEGVNAYIDHALKEPDQLPLEFKLLNIQPQKWTPEVVISRHQGLLGNINEELNIAMAINKVGEEKVKEIMWFHPDEPNLSMDPKIDSDLFTEEILDLYNAFRRSVRINKEDLELADLNSTRSLEKLNEQLDYNQVFKHEQEGSNSWVVSGDRTASGKPMMASDPHRRVSVPSLRYLVHLVAPGWNVKGGGEPTIPGVSIGHNEYGAWGLTVHPIDGEDLYVYELNPKDLKQYWYEGNWETMTEIKESIPVKDQEPFEATLQYTKHGPVTYIDSVNNKGYAVKGAWMEIGGAPYLASLRMDQAKNWEEFREACEYSHIPGENMMWADKHGDIGWQVVGIGPVRENFSGMVPIPGDGRYEWDGYLPIRERPHSVNPEEGFLVTANENVIAKDYEHRNTVAYTWADAFRGDRIREVLSSRENFTIDDMKDLQTDFFSIPARQLVPMLSEINFDSENSKDAQERLGNWDFVLDESSVGAGIYAMWEREILKKARKEFVPEEIRGLVYLQLSKILEWLKNPNSNLFVNSNMDKQEFLKTTFDESIKNLESKLGDTIENWQYGQEKFKHVKITHSLSSSLDDSWKEKVNTKVIPSGGNSFTPNVTGSYDNMYHGASFRILVDTQDWNRTLMINSPGQSGDPENRFYKNLFDMWGKGEFFPAFHSEEKIKETIHHTLQLYPEAK